ncbi:MAG: cysteine desulfurase family protein [Oscillospiraceae bacterium]|nr:cysteine desulfurase family protein [Oscillospiraceae bacterium]
MDITYFDYAATTPVRDEAIAALTGELAQFGNPSSRYEYGRQAAARLKANRETVAKALGCTPAEVFFTSCGTEGDNWAIRRGVEPGRRKGRHIITTAIEHSAVLETCRDLAAQGYEITYLKPDRQGHISAEDLKAALRPDTVLVSMMLVNNETGALLPVKECVRAVKAFDRNILFHCDAVQGFLKVPFTMASLGADMVAVSGHKIGAPKGIGALYIKRGVKLRPLLTGGGQEEGLRSGTEATGQIAAFAAACAAVCADKDRLERTAAIRDYTLTRLKESLPKLEVVSGGETAPHICAVTLPSYKSEVVVRLLGDRGVCISSGSACHKGKPSHVFAAMNLPKAWLDGMLRISFSPDTTTQQADILVSALAEAAASLFTTLS